MQIYLDMDGVITDLVGGVRKHFCVPSSWEPKEFRFKYLEEFGTTEDAFWFELDFDFWEGLGFTDDAKAILEMAHRFSSPKTPPILLTSPTRDNAGGKQAWIKMKLPEYFKDGRYIITPRKSEVAKSPQTILIDDYEKNIERWEDAGGKGILYPRPWNYLRGVTHPVKFVRRELERATRQWLIYG